MGQREIDDYWVFVKRENGLKRSRRRRRLREKEKREKEVRGKEKERKKYLLSDENALRK